MVFFGLTCMEIRPVLWLRNNMIRGIKICVYFNNHFQNLRPITFDFNVFKVSTTPSFKSTCFYFV